MGVRSGCREPGPDGCRHDRSCRRKRTIEECGQASRVRSQSAAGTFLHDPRSRPGFLTRSTNRNPRRREKSGAGGHLASGRSRNTSTAHHAMCKKRVPLSSPSPHHPYPVVRRFLIVSIKKAHPPIKNAAEGCANPSAAVSPRKKHRILGGVWAFQSRDELRMYAISRWQRFRFRRCVYGCIRRDR